MHFSLRVLPLLALGLACGLRPAPALAAALKNITYNLQPEFVDIRLAFDAKPPEPALGFRYAPDRCVLTFAGAGLSVPDRTRKALGSIDHQLLTRISMARTDGPASALQVGIYVRQRLDPELRADGNSLLLHFPVRAKNEHLEELLPGMTLAVRDQVLASGSSQTAYVVRIAPGTPVQLYAAGAGRYDGKTRLRAPSSFARREAAAVVVNGGFFNWGGQHLSTFIEDGFVQAAGVYPNRPMLVVTDEGQVQIGRFTAQTALLVTPPGSERAMRVPLSGKNVPFVAGKVIAYDSVFDRSTLPKGGMFYYLLAGGRLSYAGEDPAEARLGPDTLLIATDIIPEANPLRGIDPQASLVLETKLTDAGGQAVHARYAIGGGPQLVANGKVDISTVEDSIKADISASARARTAVGLCADGSLLIVAVKENPGTKHAGMTLQSLASLLLAQGAVTAVNFDGGGSTAMVVNGQLLNVASGTERPVSNVLIVKALDDGAAPAIAPPAAAEAAGAPVYSGDSGDGDAGSGNKYQRTP
jgi:hypothetical protein